MGTLGFLFSPEKKSKSNSSNNCTALYQGNTASSRQKKIEAAGRHTQGQFRKKKEKKGKFRLSLSEQKIEGEVEREAYIF